MSALVKKPGKKLSKVPRFGVMPSVPQKDRTKPRRHQKHKKKDMD